MPETSIHIGPLMQQLLAASEAGTTPEQAVFGLVRAARGDALAAAAIVSGLRPDDDIDGDVQTGLVHVLERLSRAAQELYEVLHDDGFAGKRPDLRLELEASNG